MAEDGTGVRARDDAGFDQSVEERNSGHLAGGDPPHAGSRRTAVVTVVALTLLGILVGSLVGGARAPQARATARIALAQDPALPSAGDQGAADPDRFVQGQLLVLAGDDLLAQVKATLPSGEGVGVTATQLGATDVAEVSARAPSAELALAATRAVVETYRRQRVAVFQARVDASLAAVGDQLGEVSEGRGVVQSTTEVRAGEYARLLAVQSQLRLAQTQTEVMVTTVETPRDVPQHRVASVLRVGLMGGVLGALAGLLIVLGRSPRGLRGARPDAR